MDSNLNNLNYKVKVLDNFLSANDYNELCKLKFNIDRNKEINIFNNKINDNGIIKSSIDENLLFRLHKNYHSKAISILGQLNQSKVNLYEYSDFTIIVTSKNARFPIHDDTPNKLLSGVIYLSPQKNTGTSFYTDKKGSNKTDITWKTNRAVFFSRKERQTWHSYKGDGLNDRMVLVFNLVSNKIREVFKIENKNYFFGNLRFKYNPYIYRFFKKTI